MPILTNLPISPLLASTTRLSMILTSPYSISILLQNGEGRRKGAEMACLSERMPVEGGMGVGAGVDRAESLREPGIGVGDSCL